MDEQPIESAFDNFQPSILILLARIYDVQMVLLRNENPTAFEQLRVAHEKGLLLSPPPSLLIDGDNVE